MFTGRWYGLASVTSSSPSAMRPRVGRSSPATIRSVVVLPQPDGPSSAKNEPRGTVSVTSSTATNEPNTLVTPSSRRSRPAESARPIGYAPITFWNASA